MGNSTSGQFILQRGFEGDNLMHKHTALVALALLVEGIGFLEFELIYLVLYGRFVAVEPNIIIAIIEVILMAIPVPILIQYMRGQHNGNI